jgi:hypothetical protein
MSKPFWETKNPAKKSTKLGPEGISLAKEMARKAGRPYPNLVDNAAAARKLKAK